MTGPDDALVTATGLLAELAQLSAATADVLAPPELSGLCEAVVETARRVFGSAACSIAVIDEDADELVYVAAAGAGAVEIVGVHLEIGRGLGGWVAQSGQPIAVSDLRADSRFARDIAEATHYVPTALMAVPIESDDRILGVLSVLDRDADRPGAARDLELATAFAAQAAAGLLAVEAFAGAGSLLLRTLARAAAQSSTLHEVLIAVPAADSRTTTLQRCAAALSELHRAGADEQELALRLIQDVLQFVRARAGS